MSNDLWLTIPPELREKPSRLVNSTIRWQMRITHLLLVLCPSIAFAFGDWPAAVGKLRSGESVVFQRLSSDETEITKTKRHIKALVSVCKAGKLIQKHSVECDFPSLEKAFSKGSTFTCDGSKGLAFSGATYTLKKYVSPEQFNSESAIFQATYQCSAGCKVSPNRLIEGQGVKEVPCAL